jgi:hypothetical protein
MPDVRSTEDLCAAGSPADRVRSYQLLAEEWQRRL